MHAAAPRTRACGRGTPCHSISARLSFITRFLIAPLHCNVTRKASERPEILHFLSASSKTTLSNQNLIAFWEHNQCWNFEFETFWFETSDSIPNFHDWPAAYLVGHLWIWHVRIWELELSFTETKSSLFVSNQISREFPIDIRSVLFPTLFLDYSKVMSRIHSVGENSASAAEICSAASELEPYH